VAVNDEEQRYKQFAKRLLGARVQVVGGIINKAAAVATIEYLRDWRLVLRV
jgi:hypothetical protein